MNDYIKREDAIKTLEGWKISGEMILATVPSADVVEVGKCKDCVHHGSFLPWCKIFEKRMNDDDYCSRFERK